MVLGLVLAVSQLLARRGRSLPPLLAGLVLSWLSAPGKLYEVQVASTPTGGSWSNLTTVSGAGAPVTALDINPSGPRYYRLRVLP